VNLSIFLFFFSLASSFIFTNFFILTSKFSASLDFFIHNRTDWEWIRYKEKFKGTHNCAWDQVLWQFPNRQSWREQRYIQKHDILKWGILPNEIKFAYYTKWGMFLWVRKISSRISCAWKRFKEMHMKYSNTKHHHFPFIFLHSPHYPYLIITHFIIFYPVGNRSSICP